MRGVIFIIYDCRSFLVSISMQETYPQCVLFLHRLCRGQLLVMRLGWGCGYADDTTGGGVGLVMAGFILYQFQLMQRCVRSGYPDFCFFGFLLFYFFWISAFLLFLDFYFSAYAHTYILIHADLITTCIPVYVNTARKQCPGQRAEAAGRRHRTGRTLEGRF